MKKILTLAIFLGIANILWGQTNLLGPENFGTSGSASMTLFTTAGSWQAVIPSITSTGAASGGGAGYIEDSYVAGSDYLTSNATATIGYSSIKVQFYEWISDDAFAADLSNDLIMEYSTNGGTSWSGVTFASSATSTSTGTLRSINLPSLAADKASVKIRFGFQNDGLGNGYYYAIDDIKIIGTAISYTHYYNVSGQPVDTVSSWGTNTDGSGTRPTNFTASGKVYHIVNGSTATTKVVAASNKWQVSGTGSKIIIGNGTTAITFNALKNVAGTVNVKNNATFSIQGPDAVPTTTLDTVATGSTIDYGGTSQTVISKTYSNLSFSGSGTKTFPSTNLTISGNLVLGTGLTVQLASGGYILTIGGTISGSSTISSTSSSKITFNKSGGGAIGTLSLNSSAKSINALTVSSGSLTLGTDITLDGTSPSLTVSSGASFDAGAYVIEGTAATELVDIQGTVYTANLNGFSGGVATTFTSNVLTPSLGTSSTVTYNASSGSQVVTPFPKVNPYQNIVLSNGATKTFGASTFYILGSFSVSGATPSINSAAVFEFQGANQTIAPLTYYTVNLSGSGTKTLSSTDSTFIITSINIADGVQLATNGKLVLVSSSGSSTAALMDNTSGANGVIGSVQVQRYLPAKSSNNGGSTPPGWFLSSPVSGATTAAFSPVNNNCFVYVNSNASGQKWVWTGAVPTSALVGTGYLVRSYASKKNYFYGPVNSGNVSVALSYSASSSDNWNLVGNPYPSRLNWVNDGTKVDMSAIGASQQCKIYTDGSHGYAILNADVNTLLSIGQGFFVQASSSGSLIFKNAARSTTGATLQRLEDDYANRLELFINKGNSSDMAVIMGENTPTLSTKYDEKYDGKKLLPPTGVPAIYMPKENQIVDIFSFGNSEGNVKVPVHLNLPSDTIYKLTFNDIEKFDPTFYIYLLDSVLNTFHDLKADAEYEFSAKAGTLKRFSVLFTTLPTDINNLDAESSLVSVFSQNGSAFINTSVEAKRITIRDISGKNVYEQVNPASKNVSVDLSNEHTGLYIASVETATGVVTRKFILNK